MSITLFKSLQIRGLLHFVKCLKNDSRRWASTNSKSWLKRHVSDPYVKASVTDKYVRSRSYYKLEELQKKFNLLRPTDTVIDLGAAPGGWSVCATQVLNSSGKLITVDLLDFEKLNNKSLKCQVIYLKGDFTDDRIQKEIGKVLEQKGQRGIVKRGYCNVILSDMLSNTTGQKDVDHFHSIDLVYSVLGFAAIYLNDGSRGSVVCKFLRGQDEKEMLDYAKSLFNDVKVVKPDASRKESKEVYILCRSKKKSGGSSSSSSREEI